MTKSYETREFMMLKPSSRDKEGTLIYGLLGGKVFKRHELVDIKAMLVRGRPGYLVKGGLPYDTLEGGKCFATYLKNGTIRELKLNSPSKLFDITQ